MHEEFRKRPSSMAVFSFLFCAQFRKCLPGFGREKQRVITKAVRPTRLVKNEAIRFSAKKLLHFSILSRCDPANKSRGPLPDRHLGQLSQQPGIIPFVIRIARFALNRGITRGMYSRRSA